MACERFAWILWVSLRFVSRVVFAVHLRFLHRSLLSRSPLHRFPRFCVFTLLGCVLLRGTSASCITSSFSALSSSAFYQVPPSFCVFRFHCTSFSLPATSSLSRSLHLVFVSAVPHTRFPQIFISLFRSFSSRFTRNLRAAHFHLIFLPLRLSFCTAALFRFAFLWLRLLVRRYLSLLRRAPSAAVCVHFSFSFSFLLPFLGIFCVSLSPAFTVARRFLHAVLHVLHIAAATRNIFRVRISASFVVSSHCCLRHLSPRHPFCVWVLRLRLLYHRLPYLCWFIALPHNIVYRFMRPLVWFVASAPSVLEFSASLFDFLRSFCCSVHPSLCVFILFPRFPLFPATAPRFLVLFWVAFLVSLRSLHAFSSLASLTRLLFCSSSLFFLLSASPAPLHYLF